MSGDGSGDARTVMRGPLRPLSLLSRWQRLAGQLGACPGGADGLLDELVARYSEPGRHYHDLAHVESVLGHIDALAGAGERVEDRRAVELAAWFHDAVHDPLADDNEARSAQLAIEMLDVAGVAPDVQQRVSALVMATEEHVPDGPGSAVLVDADLAVLGGPRDEYAAYAAAVRREYAAVDDERYRAGRSAVLRGLLDRPLLFHTATMRSWRGRIAEENITAELEALRHVPGVAIDEALRASGA